MSIPTTFEAHGHTWTKHTPGDPMPCQADAIVIARLRNWYESEAKKAAEYTWGRLRYAPFEIIGWRYATPPQEKDELARLREIVAVCMKAMPCGNIATHTPENLAGRIEDLAQSLATESLENETLREENASMLKASQDATSSHIIDKVLWESEMEKLTALSAHRLTLYEAATAENASMRTAIKEAESALLRFDIEDVTLQPGEEMQMPITCEDQTALRAALSLLQPFTESK